MSKYNRTLDFIGAALVAATKGDNAHANKCLKAALKSKDLQRAIAMLDAHNAKAFDALTASSKAASSSKSKASFSKRLTSAEADFDPLFDPDRAGEELRIEVETAAEEVDEIVEISSSDEDEDDKDDDDKEDEKEEARLQARFARMLNNM